MVLANFHAEISAIRHSRSGAPCDDPGHRASQHIGEGDFVDAILSEARQTYDRKYELKRRGFDLDRLAQRVARLYGLEPEYIMMKGRQKKRVEARSLLCSWAVGELGMTLTELARRFEMTPSAVGYAVARGARVAKQKGFKSLSDNSLTLKCRIGSRIGDKKP